MVCLVIVNGMSRSTDAAVTLGFVDAGERFAVVSAAEGAARRLAAPACALVLGDFSDASGQPLASLDVAAPSALSGRWATLRFIDERDARRCQAGPTLAFTTPGARVVHVCGRRFRKFHASDPTSAEIIVIHEFLHTLGMGENPPTSDAITAQVAKRCRF